ncbi:TPA: hypothetical protein ACSP2Z_000224 [Aeromonas hydrophila]
MSKYGRNSIDIDAIKMLQESTSAYRVEHDGSIAVEWSHIHGEIMYYAPLLKFISKMEKLVSAPELFCKSPLGTSVSCTKEGTEFYNSILLATLVHKHQNYYSLHPKLACLCNFVVKHHLFERIKDGVINSGVRATLTLQYRELIAELKSYSLLSKSHAFLKGPKKNAASLRHYVNALFGRYSRLLVMRVDLSYKREFRDSLSIDEIIKHKDALLKNRRKGALAATWVGYACRLEFAPETGFHFHLVAFKNGADFRSDVFHAGLILEEWLRITGDRGRGFNCNMKAKDNEYRFCGIGVVNHDDKEKRQYLHKALAYLTKSDRVAKLKLEKRRTFFRGTLPKKVTARGRPRVKTSTQSRQPVQQLRLVGV